MPGFATDGQLLAAWADGDAGAGNELFERHFARVARFFVNKAGDHLEDLVQQTFLACVEGRDQFREDAPFRAFLLGIAHNVLCKHYRRQGLAKAVDFGVTSVADLAPSPSVVVAERDEHRLLLDALRRIPLEFQVVIELWFWEELTAAEIAEVLGIPLGTAKTRLRRARTLLREAVVSLGDAGKAGQAALEDIKRWAADGQPADEAH